MNTENKRERINSSVSTRVRANIVANNTVILIKLFFHFFEICFRSVYEGTRIAHVPTYTETVKR